MRRPFPYIAPTFYDRSIGNVNYNALQVEVNRRYSNGLSYQVAYTQSRSTRALLDGSGLKDSP